ncbi:hypothetical protein PHLGIDRAFT_515790 [Phlebiopsis gigantea 11061_1 CR5-6]|uniref:Uncharacterized protein n=1 Tax=Phlebiopsis gigantea (strain 11061_1 CR5-6) TaxID=745531 RepID=A0A0C3NMH1_PHLG1|nr:hypothetical protein PHLGIDRAFT_515790 [Phlebiopsis gigantea 11061_1 CR5-6]
MASGNVFLPISSFIVEDWFNGLYTAAVLVTLWIISFSGHYGGAQKKYTLAFVVGMYVCSTMHSSLQWQLYSSAINNNEDTDGVKLITSLTTIAPWLEATGDAFFCLNIFLADCLFIWRCWVIWQRRWVIVILPICASITGAVLAGLIVHDQVVGLESDVTYVVVQKTQQFVTLSTAYFALSIATSLATTLLITLRILSVQHATRKAGARTSSYNAAVEILVESAALYSATLLVFVVLNSRHDINFYYAQNIHAQVAGLAPTLIILRVAAGKSRRDEEWSTTMESVRFAHPASTLSRSMPEHDVERADTGVFASVMVQLEPEATAGEKIVQDGKERGLTAMESSSSVVHVIG